MLSRKVNRYVYREVPVLLRAGGELKRTRRIIIGYYNAKDDIVYPHPITDFIETEYFNYSLSLSHQRLPAITIVQFLNYVTRMVEANKDHFEDLSHTGIPGLTFKHGAMFLNYLAEETVIERDSFNSKINHLTNFYNYLIKKKILIRNLVIHSREKKKKRQSALVSPFKNVKYPSSNTNKLTKKKDIITSSNQNRIQMMREFLLTAYITEPSIAFGVALLFFGGIRIGECVNLMRSSIKPQNNSLYGEKGLILEVRDNQEKLFKDLTNTATLEVKNPRDQAILNESIVSWLYKQHLGWLDKMEEKRLISNRRAVFINEEGNPLSSAVFRKKFERIKAAYLDVLAKTPGRLQDFIDLNETKWSSHIGRGTFTNLIISAGFTVEQTAIARGDKDLESALQYTDILTSMHNISIALEVLTNVHQVNLEEISVSPLKKTWKEVVHFGKTSIKSKR